MKAMTILMLGAAALWSPGPSRAADESAARRRAEIVAEVDLRAARGKFAALARVAGLSAGLATAAVRRAGDSPRRRAS
jgi:hypothetical protein